MGSSMPSPTETPPALTAPLLAASMTPGPPPVITAYPASASPVPIALGLLVLAVPGPGPRGAEDRDRRAEFREQPEALDELGLDPQHPPGVGMHPVAGPAPVEQPLVGGGLRDEIAAQHGWSLAADRDDVTQIAPSRSCHVK